MFYSVQICKMANKRHAWAIHNDIVYSIIKFQRYDIKAMLEYTCAHTCNYICRHTHIQTLNWLKSFVQVQILNSSLRNLPQMILVRTTLLGIYTPIALFLIFFFSSVLVVLSAVFVVFEYLC